MATLDKSSIINNLRQSAKDLLSDLESNTGLNIVFEQISSSSHVQAEYFFNTQTNIPTIYLNPNTYDDANVMHELMHMKLEMIDGFHVLAWKQGVRKSDGILRAFGRIRAYVDDEVVHARLASAGYKIDGEVFRPQLFNEIYRKSERYLKKAKLRPDDGMAHLDDIGYGELCRSSFLVQAELLLDNYRNELLSDRIKRAERFIDEFRRFRSPEAKKADAVLDLFSQHDVQTVSGHKEILWRWAQMEGLDQFVGLSSYQFQNSRYILPWPK